MARTSVLATMPLAGGHLVRTHACDARIVVEIDEISDVDHVMARVAEGLLEQL
jgi:hypothetical protein